MASLRVRCAILIVLAAILPVTAAIIVARAIIANRRVPAVRTSIDTPNPDYPPEYALGPREILAYAEVVQQIDTSGVPPTASVTAGDPPDRADEVRPSLDRDEVLEGAPDAAIDAGFFKVPRVFG